MTDTNEIEEAFKAWLAWDPAANALANPTLVKQEAFKAGWKACERAAFIRSQASDRATPKEQP